MVFLLDASGDVSREEYGKEKDFVKSLGKALNLGPGKSRAAVYVYSSYARHEVRWDSSQTADSFGSAIDSLSYIGRSRRMDRALEGAAQVLREGRGSVPKVVILVTAGKQIQEPGTKLLATAAQPLQVLGASTYVVAIGSRTDVAELKPAVKRPGDVLIVRSFDELRPQTLPIAEHIVKGSGMFDVRMS